MTVEALNALGNDVKRQPNRHKIHSAVMCAIQRFEEADWRTLFVVVRDAAMSTPRLGSGQ